MPRRTAALPLVALATLGLATACEKQSPFVTLHAGGNVVKARAVKYCRAKDRCNESTERPVLHIKPGDTLGIDVPRSVSEQGWRLGDQGAFRYDHYYAFRLPDQLESGAEQALVIQRDPKHGEGVWQFTIRVR
jgi:hypothetical protein